MAATLQGFDIRLEQAALSLGASRITALRRITLPLILPGVLSAALFAFLTLVRRAPDPALPVRRRGPDVDGADLEQPGPRGRSHHRRRQLVLIGVTTVVLGASAFLRGRGE